MNIRGEPVLCRHCQSPLWRLETTSTTLLDFSSGKIRLGDSLEEEIRCARCYRRADRAERERMRQHEMYQAANGLLLEEAADEVFLDNAIQTILTQTQERSSKKLANATLGPSSTKPSAQQASLAFVPGKAPRFRNEQDIADWFVWCSENALIPHYGHYQARILHYEVFPGQEEKVRFFFREFDTLGPVRYRTRPLKVVNQELWANAVPDWQPLPVAERTWYSERFRREMQEKWEMLQRVEKIEAKTATPSQRTAFVRNEDLQR